MKTGNPEIFQMLTAQVICNQGHNITEEIGEISLRYENIPPYLKETCKQIVFKEFNFTKESFKDWHQHNLDNFPTECAIFVSFVITFYEPSLKIDKLGFYIPTGILNLSKKRLSPKDLWGYYEKYNHDREIHPVSNWRKEICS